MPRFERGQLSLLLVLSLSFASILFCSERLAVQFGLMAPLTFSLPRPAGPVTHAAAAGELEAVHPSPDAADSVIPALDAGEPAPSTLLTPQRLRHGMWVPILLYHYIRVPPKGDRLGAGLSVTPANFTLQMRYLRDHGFTTITMRELDLALTQHRPLPPRPVALTFDDGYRDFYTTAAPIMREMGVTATSYVPTELVGRPNYMTWEMIQEMDAEGFDMGGHTEFHIDLTHVSASRAELEIESCKAQLESHLGHQVVDFAYPYGKYNAAVERMVEDAGWWSATTTNFGGLHNSDQMFTLTRMRVGESLYEFESTLLPTVIAGSNTDLAPA